MIKSSERKHIFPLLYIQQPQMKSPKAKMQSDFRFWDNREPIKKQKEPDEKNNEGLEEKIVNAQEKTGKSSSENKQIKHEIEQEKLGEQDREIGVPNNAKQDNHPEFIDMNSVVQAPGSVELNTTGPYASKEKDNKNIREKNEIQIVNKRVPFNEQGFENKLKYLKAIPMATVRIRFEFITTDKKYTGYFLANKDNLLQVLPIEGKEPVGLPIQSLIDIRMIGI